MKILYLERKFTFNELNIIISTDDPFKKQFVKHGGKPFATMSNRFK